MKLNEKAEVFVPDGAAREEAVARATQLCIGAHPDDIEIMAPNMILDGYGNDDDWFLGVVATDGAGSPRAKIYADYTDEEMIRVRQQEQRKAAYVGEYAAVVMLNHPSSVMKDGGNAAPVADIKTLIRTARPRAVCTHSLADKHDTHVATALRTIAAIRELPAEERPEKLYGSEVWRSLDWLLDEDTVTFDISRRDNVTGALVALFDSQISGGKRYDLATTGRRRERATYLESHGTDTATQLSLAMDLTPLIQDTAADIAVFIGAHIDKFRNSVVGNVKRLV